MEAGKKYFYITKNVSLALVEGHDNKLKNVFLDIVKDTLPIECRLTLHIRPFKRIAKCTFYVSFGYRLEETKKMSSILEKVIDMSIMKMIIDKQTSDFNRLKARVVNDSTIYKPKQIKKYAEVS